MRAFENNREKSLRPQENHALPELSGWINKKT